MSRIFILVTLLLSACMSHTSQKWVQTYDGNELPDGQEVKLHHQFKFYNSVLVIDNKIYTKSRDDSQSQFKLRSGRHSIKYYLDIYGRGWAIGEFTVEMEAGHTYVLKNEIDTNFHLFYSRPWEATVILRDETDGKDVGIQHFPSLVSWDKDIRKLHDIYDAR
jgi:hypothetical protein